MVSFFTQDPDPAAHRSDRCHHEHQRQGRQRRKSEQQERRGTRRFHRYADHVGGTPEK